MRKLLYTTTALVGAAFLAEAAAPAKAEVNVSLNYRAAFFSSSKDDKDKDTNLRDGNNKDRSTNLKDLYFLDFEGTKDHPNGLTTGAKIRTRLYGTAGGGGDAIGDAYGYISGAFGKVQVGDQNDAGYASLGYGTPGTANFGAVDPWHTPGGVYINTSATPNAIGFRQKSIAYFSPSFTGFSFAVSYAPQNEEGTGTSLVSKSGDIEDAFALAALYSNSFNDVGFSGGFSYATASQVPTHLKYNEISSVTTAGAALTSGANDPARAGAHETDAIDTLDDLRARASLVTALDGNSSYQQVKEDPSAWAAYVSFNFNQFTLGGSYGSWETYSPGDKRRTESTAYALGASYSVDALTFGLGWAKQDDERTNYTYTVQGTDQALTAANLAASIDGKTFRSVGTRIADKESSVLSFTVDYAVGDGANIDFVLEQGSTEEGAADSDTTGFGVGISVSF